MKAALKPTLHIIKASAGSGKTYRLTSDYLALLFSNPRVEERGAETTTDFRNILAVTFTVKATAEMKERIVKDLYEIARGKNPTKCAEIALKAGIEPDEIVRRAPKILGDLLRDYSSFRIQTIDSFFREIVNAFAIELDHGGNIDIELDTPYIVELAADAMLRNLDENDGEYNNGILEWLASLYIDNLNKGKGSRGIRENIKEFAQKILFSDSMLQELMLLEEYDDTEIQQWGKTIKTAQKQKRELLVKSVNAFGEILQNHNLLTEIPSRGMLHKPFFETKTKIPYTWKEYTKIYSGINKLVFENKTLAKVLETGEGLVSKKTQKENPDEANKWLRAFEQGELPLQKYYDEWQQTIISLNDLDLLGEFVSLYPVLRALKKEADKYKRANHLLTTTDINHLLAQITRGPQPFIYEKIGTRIRHFMIDEFQDTNRQQWENFAPLLEESLSRGYLNYIVGDVKQSIYRFRGSNSSLLNHEVKEHPTIGVYSEDNFLESNWRSAKEIVEFNNAFFTGIIEEEQAFLPEYRGGQQEQFIQTYKEVYSPTSVRQHTEKKQAGYVTITDATPTEEEQNRTKDLLKERLEDLFERGYQPRDIAILTRFRREAAEIADWITEFSHKAKDGHKELYTFQTDEALLLSRSDFIRLLVATMKSLANPSAPNPPLEISVLLRRLTDRYPRLVPEGESVESLSESLRGLPAHGLSMYETIIQAIRIFKEIPDEELIYLNGFLDLIADFSSRNISVYSKFVSWWEDTQDSQSVSMAEEGVNALTIATIHKSKGLEYPIVILPFCTWSVGYSGGITTKDVDVFSLPEDLPQYGLPSRLFIPINLSKMRRSHFVQETFSIEMETYLDNLNLLYVAFTRPATELHILTNTKSRTKGKNITDLILSRLSTLGVNSSNSLADAPYSIGYPTCPQEKALPSSSSGTPGRLLSQRERADLSLSGDDYLYYSRRQSQRRHGIIMHRILSEIVDQRDLEKVLEKYTRMRAPFPQAAEEIRDKWKGIVSNPLTKSWFDPEEYTILTERAILSQTSASRPDRLMISKKKDELIIVDYKFGEENASKYERQMKRYIRELNRCGFSLVRGYLWYDLSTLPVEVICPQSYLVK